MSTSFGFIETKGLVAAIAAADKITRSSGVNLIGKEITPPSLVTIKFSGEIKEVEAALIAGEEAAREMGAFIAKLMISSPHEDLSKVAGELKPLSKLNDQKIQKSEPVIKREVKPKTEQPKKEKPEIPSPKKEVIETTDTISRLREEALVKKAETKVNEKKEEEIIEDKSNDIATKSEELKGLNVHQLRKLARSYDNFPIKGREISRANRNELLEYFENLK